MKKHTTKATKESVTLDKSTRAEVRRTAANRYRAANVSERCSHPFFRSVFSVLSAASAADVEASHPSNRHGNAGHNI